MNQREVRREPDPSLRPRLCLMLTAVLAAPAFALAAKPGTPIVVVLLADDLGYGDLACYGCPDTRTPNLNRMAAEGAKFTSAYASAPVCSPTRVALLTGQYQQRQGNAFEAYLGGGSPGIDGTKQKALATLLKEVGSARSVRSAAASCAARPSRPSSIASPAQASSNSKPGRRSPESEGDSPAEISSRLTPGGG